MQFLGNVIRNWGIAFEKLASLENSKWFNQKFKGRGEKGKVNASCYQSLMFRERKINSQCWLNYIDLTMSIKIVMMDSPGLKWEVLSKDVNIVGVVQWGPSLETTFHKRIYQNDNDTATLFLS